MRDILQLVIYGIMNKYLKYKFLMFKRLSLSQINLTFSNIIHSQTMSIIWWSESCIMNINFDFTTMAWCDIVFLRIPANTVCLILLHIWCKNFWKISANDLVSFLHSFGFLPRKLARSFFAISRPRRLEFSAFYSGLFFEIVYNYILCSI